MAVSSDPLVYRPSWLLRTLLGAYQTVIGPLVFTIFGPYRVSGRDKIPATGGVLLLGNHLSITDPPFTQLGCRRQIRFMASSDVFTWKYIGPFARWYGAFPVQIKSPDKAALKTAIDLLKAGEVVCIYPEGGTSPGGLAPLFAGPALILKHVQVPVVCFGLVNTGRIIYHDTTKLKRSGELVEMVIGDPIHFPEGTKASAMMQRIESELLALSRQEKQAAEKTPVAGLPE